MEPNSFMLSDYQREELKSVFDMFKPVEGVVTIDNINTIQIELENSSKRAVAESKIQLDLQSTSEPNSPERIENRFFECETSRPLEVLPNDSSSCDFEGFVNIYQEALNHCDLTDILIQAFRLLDIRKKGYIDADDLRTAAAVLGEHIHDDDEARRLIKLADKDGKGKLNFQDFQAFFLKNLKSD